MRVLAAASLMGPGGSWAIQASVAGRSKFDQLAARATAALVWMLPAGRVCSHWAVNSGREAAMTERASVFWVW